MNLKSKFFAASSLLLASGALLSSAYAEKLVILHTNDTHSQIDPDEKTGMGGILRRKVVIDSVREANKNVMLIDAGDVVQGTLFFNLYRGEVENMLMNKLGYDIRILGNHEFDNGVDELADNYANTTSELLSTNYDLSATPLGKEFKPYTTRRFGDKKIGFIAINLDPKGMIAEGNYDGVKYLDPYDAANSMAWYLKHIDTCDYVIALSHIGYEPENTTIADIPMIEKSKDIDLVIGGHTHTLINPADKNSPRNYAVNLLGDTITVTQVGKGGKYIGCSEIDLETGRVDYKLIPIDARLDSKIDPKLEALLVPYRHGVDSLMTTPLAQSAIELRNDEAPLLNFVADFIRDNGNRLLKESKVSGKKTVDLAIINKGGLRRSLPKGGVSEGMIITMMPFANRTSVVDIKGKDLIAVLDTMAGRGGDGVSSEMEVVFDPASKTIVEAEISGKKLDPEATYRVATIDYLAHGGDYLTGFLNSTPVAVSDSVLFDDLISYLRKNYSKKKINPSAKVRMRPLKE